MSFKIVVEDVVFYSIEEFARNIYLHPDASKKILTSTKFLSLLAKEDRDKFDKIVSLTRAVNDIDAFLFYAQYLLCPHMELRHHGYIFDSLEELGKKILSFGPEVDVYLMDFLKYKLLSKYMKDQGLDIKEPMVFERVIELEKKFIENPNKAYFLLGFALAKCNTIVYEHEVFDDVKTFISRMITDRKIIRFSSTLESSQYVYAWLEVNGYENVVNNYRSLVETIEKLENKL